MEKKRLVRRVLEGMTIGWTVSTMFFTPPVKEYEVIVVLVLLVVITVLDFAEIW